MLFKLSLFFAFSDVVNAGRKNLSGSLRAKIGGGTANDGDLHTAFDKLKMVKRGELHQDIDAGMAKRIFEHAFDKETKAENLPIFDALIDRIGIHHVKEFIKNKSIDPIKVHSYSEWKAIKDIDIKPKDVPSSSAVSKKLLPIVSSSALPFETKKAIFEGLDANEVVQFAFEQYRAYLPQTTDETGFATRTNSICKVSEDMENLIWYAVGTETLLDKLLEYENNGVYGFSILRCFMLEHVNLAIARLIVTNEQKRVEILEMKKDKKPVPASDEESLEILDWKVKQATKQLPQDDAGKPLEHAMRSSAWKELQARKKAAEASTINPLASAAAAATANLRKTIKPHDEVDGAADSLINIEGSFNGGFNLENGLIGLASSNAKISCSTVKEITLCYVSDEKDDSNAWSFIHFGKSKPILGASTKSGEVTEWKTSTNANLQNYKKSDVSFSDDPRYNSQDAAVLFPLLAAHYHRQVEVFKSMRDTLGDDHVEPPSESEPFHRVWTAGQWVKFTMVDSTNGVILTNYAMSVQYEYVASFAIPVAISEPQSR